MLWQARVHDVVGRHTKIPGVTVNDRRMLVRIAMDERVDAVADPQLVSGNNQGHVLALLDSGRL